MQNYDFLFTFANVTLLKGDAMDELDKKSYKIREVAEILSIPASTLRFWESRFTIIKPKRNANGTRLYTPRDIEKIRMINYLVKDKGLKLEAAEQQISRNHSGVSRRYEVIERLQNIRNELSGMLDALNSRQ